MTDEFVVPQNFNEFYERYPNYVQRWVRKKLNWNWHRAKECLGGGYTTTYYEHVNDVTQNLLLHLVALPATSKYREQGYTDPIQLFRPMHENNIGAQFFRYVQRVLANRLATLYHHDTMNPVSRLDNVDIEPETKVANAEDEAQLSLWASQCYEAVVEQAPELLPALNHILYDGYYWRTTKGEDPAKYTQLRAKLRKFLTQYSSGVAHPVMDRRKEKVPNRSKRSPVKVAKDIIKIVERPEPPVPVIRAHDYIPSFSNANASELRKLVAFINRGNRTQAGARGN